MQYGTGFPELHRQIAMRILDKQLYLLNPSDSDYEFDIALIYRRNKS
jgi:hypothetical protein